MKAHASLASWPGRRPDQAAQLARQTPQEPLFGDLSVAHLQLVPQSHGQLTETRVDELLEALPGTQFRLHANVRVLREHRLADLASYSEHLDWFSQAAKISRRLRAPAYTAHSGRRTQASLAEVFDNTRRCADLFGCVVGVEGLYPTPDNVWLLSSWDEYAQLLDSGVPYALDLSHLHILATCSGQASCQLVKELLASPACIEVHVSDNDGDRDSHQVCRQPSWWYPLLQDHYTHHPSPGFTLFSEGNHRKENQ